MNTTADIDIQRPIEDVFILATDHIPAWSGIVTSALPTHIAEDGGVGTRFQFTARTPDGGSMKSEGEVVEYVPPTRSAMVMRGRYHEIEVSFDLEPLPDRRTRVTQQWSLRIKGIPGLFLRFMQPLFRKHRERIAAVELDRLRIHCESGAPATPGGPETDPGMEAG